MALLPKSLPVVQNPRGKPGKRCLFLKACEAAGIDAQKEKVAHPRCRLFVLNTLIPYRRHCYLNPWRVLVSQGFGTGPLGVSGTLMGIRVRIPAGGAAACDPAGNGSEWVPSGSLPGHSLIRKTTSSSTIPFVSLYRVSACLHIHTEPAGNVLARFSILCDFFRHRRGGVLAPTVNRALEFR